MITTILYLIIYYLLIQLKYNVIQQYTDVFIFWPDVVYKIGSHCYCAQFYLRSVISAEIRK